jgi:hypothetical protein
VTIYTSGLLFPPGGPLATHAARTTSIILDASGRIAGAVAGASGGMLSWSHATSGWSEEAASTSPLTLPATVLRGYTLDSASGLWAWGGGVVSSGHAPYITAVSGSSGIYLVGPSGVYTSGGTAVSGISTSGVVAAIASGSSFWLSSASAIYHYTLTGLAAASGASTSLPFTATTIAASGNVLAIGGYVPHALTSGAYAVAAAPGGESIVYFLPSGTAKAWTLSGTPATWNLLASTTGLPSYSTGITAAWVPIGDQLLLSDYGSGAWMAFSYTGGVLSLLASAALSGISAGIAISTDSSYALIPTPAASGFTMLIASGVGWAVSGLIVSGLPGAGAAVAVSGDTFAVGSSGRVDLLSLIGGNWLLQQTLSTHLQPAGAVLDRTAQNRVWWVGNSGGAVATTWTAGAASTYATGTWTSGASPSVRGVVLELGQLIVADGANGQLSVAGGDSETPIAPKSSVSISSLTDVAGPLADFTIATTSSGTASQFYTLQGNYTLSVVASGVYATLTAGGSLSATSGLGQHVVPSALGLGAGGSLLLATREGWLGTLSGAPSGLTQVFASGGLSALLAASGLVWGATTVQGGLFWASGL